MQNTLHKAVSILNRGGVIAYPTEAVYGLGCRADSRPATERICSLKQRPIDQGVIVLIRDLEQLGDWIEPIDEHQRARLASTWPGPVTWLIPASADCPSWLRGRHGSLAARQSAHPLCRDLCNTLDTPLVSTSANRSGQPPARSAADVQACFGDNIDLVIDAELGDANSPSEIRDLLSGQRLR
jgi:L-threonylcarbamoyladenylate synthase